VVVLAFTLVFSLAGCSGKKPITADQFEEIMEVEDFDVKSFENSNSENLCASKKDPFTLLWFNIYDSEDEAKDFFDINIDQRKDFIKQEDLDMKSTTKRSGNYEKITFSGEITDGNYQYVVYIRVKKTVLIITTKGDSKSVVNRVEDIVSTMGY
jgi:hypothetical protein